MPVGVFSRGTTRISGSLSCGAREVRSPCGGDGDRVMALESREGTRASRRVEEGLSRSFSGGGGKPSCPSPSAGDLRELPRVPLRGEGSCGGGGAPRVQKIFPTQESNPHLLCPLHWQACSLALAPPGKPIMGTHSSRFLQGSQMLQQV